MPRRGLRRGGPAGADAAKRDPFLPSRREALRSCVEGLREGLLLVTGEPGVGKTWLVQRLANRTSGPGPRHWVLVDLSPSMGPDDLIRTIGVALGLEPNEADRWALARVLTEEADDGRPVGLALDEAHTASDAVLEEIRILSNRLGRTGGFGAIVLVGQSSLIRRLQGRALMALNARVARHVRLRPLDLDEMTRLARSVVPRKFHRRRPAGKSHGGPSSPVRERPRGRRDPAHIAPRQPRVPIFAPAPAAMARSEDLRLDAELAQNLFVADKPLLRDEDGVVEVGWSPEDPGAEAPTDLTSARAPNLPQTGSGPEPIDDHYAALQAWNEWARNQGRRPATVEATRASGVPQAESGDVTGQMVRIEQGQDFGPYSQLFSQTRDLDEED